MGATETNKAKSVKGRISADIIVDTREQKPWLFNIKPPSNFTVGECITETLSAGDYSLRGFSDPTEHEHTIAIERKNSLEEFLSNIGRSWDRFQNELVKLSKFSKAYIVVEDDFKNAHYRFKTSDYFNMPPEFIIKRITEIEYEWNVLTYFCSNRTFAQKRALNLFKYFLYYNVG